MAALFNPPSHPTLSDVSIARLEASGHTPIIPGNCLQYEIQSLDTLQDQTPYYRLVRTL